MLLIKKIGAQINTLQKLMYFHTHFLWNSTHDYHTNTHYHPQTTFHLPPLKHGSHLPITTPWYVNWPIFFTIPTSKSHSVPTTTTTMTTTTTTTTTATTTVNILHNRIHNTNTHTYSDIYQQKCHTYNLSSIGQTGLRLELRFLEHICYIT